MYPKHPEHLRGFDYLGVNAYFLTFCTVLRRQIFTNGPAVDLVQLQFRRAAVHEGFGITAYCYMPDHVHLLVEGQHDNSDLRRFIRLAKQLSGFHYKRQFRNDLWQRYGFEHVLRGSESILGVARYIFENPVRAGLVKSLHEYPWLGSDTYGITAIAEAMQMAPGWRKSG